MERIQSSGINPAQRILYRQGEKAVGPREARYKHPTEVRREGLNRLGRQLGAVVLVGAGLLLARGVVDALKGPDVPELTETVTAKPGTTAYGEVIRRLAPGTDPRPIVDEVLKGQAFKDGVLQPGERFNVLKAQEESAAYEAVQKNKNNSQG